MVVVLGDDNEGAFVSSLICFNNLRRVFFDGWDRTGRQ